MKSNKAICILLVLLVIPLFGFRFHLKNSTSNDIIIAGWWVDHQFKNYPYAACMWLYTVHANSESDVGEDYYGSKWLIRLYNPETYYALYADTEIKDYYISFDGSDLRVGTVQD